MKEQHIQNKNIILNFQIIQYLSIKYKIKCYNGRHYCKSLSRGRNSLNIQLATYCMYTNKMNNFIWLFAIEDVECHNIIITATVAIGTAFPLLF